MNLIKLIVNTVIVEFLSLNYQVLRLDLLKFQLNSSLKSYCVYI